MPQLIPLADRPSQNLTVQLGNQNCQISVITKSTGLFLNLSVNNAAIISGVICRNLNRIVRSAYLGFSGDLTFYDTQSADDPSYLGLGTRFVLLYYTEAELAALGVT